MPVKSPFKFLDSYTPDDRHVFFGREGELEELHQKIFKEKQLIIYGSSGTGKTSLIQCGLALKLEDSDWLPVTIRRGNDINQSLSASLSQMALTPIRKRKSLTEQIHSVYLDYFKPVFLIFDQFEELFVFGHDEEIHGFIQSVKECLASDLTCRFIFVIRGEYLENITLFEEAMPKFFDNRMRIEKMTRNNAARVITESCRAFGITCSENFPGLLLDRLSTSKTTVELTYLQVYLDKLYKNAAAEDASSIQFNEALLNRSGMIEDVLSEFLDEQVSHTKDPATSITVLKAFVSGEGTKRPCTLSEVHDFCLSLGKPVAEENLSALIKQLVDLRILKDMDETGRYELRHDALALKIYEQISLAEKELLEARQFLTGRYSEYQKRSALLTPADLQFIAPYENKLFLNEEQKQFIERSKAQERRRRNRRRNVAAAAGMLLILILTGFTIFAMKQRNEAREQAAIAEQKTLEALNQKEIAEKSTEMAMEASRQAMDAKSYAELQSRLAAEQKKIAEEQAERARQQTELATTQQTLAEKQKQLAEQKSSEAIRQKQIADSAEQEATRLRLLTLSQTLAFKSLQEKNDRQLSALLASVACNLSKENGGNVQDPQLYAALFESLKNVNAAYTPVIIKAGGTIKALGLVNAGKSILVLRGDGMLNSYSASDYSLQNSSRATAASTINTGYISPDGKFVIAGYDDNSLTFYQVQNGNVSAPLPGHTGLVRAAAFSLSANLYATGGRDSTVIIWSHGTLQKRVRFDSRIKSLSMSKDNSTLAVGCDDGSMHLLYITTETKKLLASQSPARIQSGSFSTGGSYVAFGSSSGIISAYQSNGSALRSLNSNSGSIDFVAADEAAGVLAGVSVTRVICLFQLSDLSLKPIIVKDLQSAPAALAVSSTGKILVACADNSIREFASSSLEVMEQLNQLITRNFTRDEWNSYIGNDVTYRKIRADLP